MSLKAFVTNPAMWDAFLKEVDEMIDAQHRSMEQASSTETLFKAQGAIHSLRKLKLLRDKYKD